ncbi:hypothetical protein EYF80_015744 [Liparis tanakae]|uniref:Uncharacterized protein n=1 Tax=Liparis tanakae TaxID=230148 RepID=A0A4Z2IAD6_9TELE|nr:hypothetical protein EYF80_015744 [Liparis tanakae]
MFTRRTETRRSNRRAALCSTSSVTIRLLAVVKTSPATGLIETMSIHLKGPGFGEADDGPNIEHSGRTLQLIQSRVIGLTVTFFGLNRSNVRTGIFNFPLGLSRVFSVHFSSNLGLVHPIIIIITIIIVIVVIIVVRPLLCALRLLRAPVLHHKQVPHGVCHGFSQLVLRLLKVADEKKGIENDLMQSTPTASKTCRCTAPCSASAVVLEAEFTSMLASASSKVFGVLWLHPLLTCDQSLSFNSAPSWKLRRSVLISDLPQSCSHVLQEERDAGRTCCGAPCCSGSGSLGFTTKSHLSHLLVIVLSDEIQLTQVFMTSCSHTDSGVLTSLLLRRKKRSRRGEDVFLVPPLNGVQLGVVLLEGTPEDGADRGSVQGVDLMNNDLPVVDVFEAEADLNEPVHDLRIGFTL